MFKNRFVFKMKFLQWRSASASIDAITLEDISGAYRAIVRFSWLSVHSVYVGNTRRIVMPFVLILVLLVLYLIGAASSSAGRPSVNRTAADRAGVPSIGARAKRGRKRREKRGIRLVQDEWLPNIMLYRYTVRQSHSISYVRAPGDVICRDRVGEKLGRYIIRPRNILRVRRIAAA